MRTSVRIVAHPADTRTLARKLRRGKRLSIDELARRLGVSRSTVYNWVSDIPIPGSGSGGGFSQEARRRGTRAMREGRRRLRETYYTFGLEVYPSLSSQPAFKDFLVSYVAVGKKSDLREVSFAHPDPLMMQLAVGWLRDYGRNRLRYRLQLPADVDVGRAQRFWAERMGVPVEEIVPERSTADGSLAAAPVRRNILGTLRIASTDTLLRVELQAWIDCARSEWRDATEISRKVTPPC